jgi:hypothetical protein
VEDIEFLLLMAVALLATGVAAGILAGLLGVGGGIVMVPVLYYVFGALDVSDEVRIHMAVGTSLAAMIPTSIRSALAHKKRGTVDIRCSMPGPRPCCWVRSPAQSSLPMPARGLARGFRGLRLADFAQHDHRQRATEDRLRASFAPLAAPPRLP